MHKVHFTAEIRSNKKICPKYYRLSLDAKGIVKKVKPGQFIHLRVTQGLNPFFRRPFSIFQAKKTCDILYEVVGQGTQILAEKKKGEHLDVLGPLGHGFSLPQRRIKQIIMVAGGVGIAPFLILSDALKEFRGRKILLYGARSKGHIFPFKGFRDSGVKTQISTNDGSVGHKGYVTELLSELKVNPKEAFLYACGPRPMLRAVSQYALEKQIAAEGSFEEVMACGLGACLGCAIKTKQGYQTVCRDGPVFKFEDIVS